MTDQSDPPNQKGSNPLILVAALVIFGVVLGGLGLSKYRSGQASAEWPTVSGTISSGRVQSHRRDGRTEYMPQVQYSYQVGNRTFTGTRITVSDVYQRNRGSAEDILRKFPAGATVTVYYDPDDPAMAVLEQGMPGNVKVLLGAGAGCLVLAVLIGISAVRSGSRA